MDTKIHGLGSWKKYLTLLNPSFLKCKMHITIQHHWTTLHGSFLVVNRPTKAKHALNCCSSVSHLASNTREGGPRDTSSVHTFVEGIVTHKCSPNRRRGPQQKCHQLKSGSGESEEDSSLVVASL
jgi:hypothetical protein